MSTENWWLGTPGAMRQIPQCRNGAADGGSSRSDQLTVTADGGTTRVALLDSKRAWSLPYGSLTDDEADLMDSFYDGLFGDGPFCLVDPMRRNVLSMDDATMNLRGYGAPSWAPTSGTLTAGASTPQGLATGSYVWSGGTTGATFGRAFDANTAIAYVPAETVTWSVYLLASSAATVSVSLRGLTMAGVNVGSVLSASASVTTGWRRFVVSAAPGLFGSAAFVTPLVTLGSSAPTSVTIAAAQVEYGGLTDWQRGYGAPRVNLGAALGHSVQQFDVVDKTLVLAQC